MKFLGAKIREQNVTFGIVAVKPYVLQDPAARENMQDFGVRVFGYCTYCLDGKKCAGCSHILGTSRYRQIFGQGSTPVHPLEGIHHRRMISKDAPEGRLLSGAYQYLPA